MAMTDLVYVPVALLLVGMLMYTGWTLIDEFDSGITGKNANYNAKYVDDTKQAFEVFNYMIIFILVSIGVGAVALAARLRTHPAFAPIAIVIGGIFVMFSAIIANVFYEFYSVPEFTNAVTAMDNFVAINLKLPLITGALFAVIFIALYGKQFFVSETPL